MSSDAPGTDLPPSPYEAPGFYERAIAEGKHRDIVGGRWEETGMAQMALLKDAGLQPHHRFLDIGAGSLRLGCKLAGYLEPGHYWGTDASREIMLAGLGREMMAVPQMRRPDPTQLIADARFDLPGVPETITHALCFAVFPHLAPGYLDLALKNLAVKLPQLELFLFTVFLVPEALHDAPFRQKDGVVTHPARPPYHRRKADVMATCAAHGWTAKAETERWLPRGQILFHARRA